MFKSRKELKVVKAENLKLQEANIILQSSVNQLHEDNLMLTAEIKRLKKVNSNLEAKIKDTKKAAPKKTTTKSTSKEQSK